MNSEERRDQLFQSAVGELCEIRAKQARERGEKEFHIGDLDTPEYRWFFDAGMDAALNRMVETFAKVPV